MSWCPDRMKFLNAERDALDAPRPGGTSVVHPSSNRPHHPPETAASLDAIRDVGGREPGVI